jgi:alanyl-tRNA synthetase
LRMDTMNNHTATHLLHAALRKILGVHVQQKGSLVAPDHLRFDFSHFSKVSKEELESIEEMVNEKIRENIVRQVDVMPVEEAMKTGAMALFGEKYGDRVRVVTFNPSFSRELCGGTHVSATGAIGYFKIISESAVAAGVRRIEAVTGREADKLIRGTFNRIAQLENIVGADLEKGIDLMREENTRLKKQVEEFSALQVNQLKEQLKSKIEMINGISFIAAKLSLPSPDAMKKLAFDLRNEVDNLFFAGGTVIDNKALLSIIISDQLVKDKSLDAGKIIRSASKEIHGGGGGQKFYATAGGTNVEGISNALQLIRQSIQQ